MNDASHYTTLPSIVIGQLQPESGYGYRTYLLSQFSYVPLLEYNIHSSTSMCNLIIRWIWAKFERKKIPELSEVVRVRLEPVSSMIRKGGLIRWYVRV